MKTYPGSLSLLALAVCGALMAAPIRAEQEQAATLHAARTVFQGQLDNLATYMPVLDISRRVLRRLDAEPAKLPYALEWAQARAEGAKSTAAVNSLYFMLHSDLSVRTARLIPPREKEFAAHARAAWQSLVSFETLLLSDVARCKSPAVREGALQLLPRRYEDVAALQVAVSPVEAAAFWDHALTLEEAAAGRPPNPEVCNNSIAVAIADMAGKPLPEKLDPAYLDDAAWANERRKLRQTVEARKKAVQDTVAKSYAERKAREDAERAQSEGRAAAEAAVRKSQEEARQKREEAARARAEALRAKAEPAPVKAPAAPPPKTPEQIEKEKRERLEAEQAMRQRESYERQLREERAREGYYEEGSELTGGGEY